MSTHAFLAQDESGRRCRIQVTVDAASNAASDATSAGSSSPQGPVYQLEDGSRVRRVDNDTFQIIATGAYVTRVID